ncbi:MAG: hypothetical protein IPI67_01935 [Myxococcales bacterium]|nr:hypothetical protein [Myxococcales bacterium]
MNAVRHGLSARTVVLPDESPEEFNRLAQALADDVEPTGAIEQLLLERLATTAWRLRRASRIEADVLSEERVDAEGKEISLGLGFVRAVAHGESLTVLARHERALERGFLAALHELSRVGLQRGDGEVELGEGGEAAEATVDSSNASDHVVAAGAEED